MNQKQLSNSTIIKEVKKVIPDVKEILLFGSRSIGSNKPDSDYDVRAIVPESKLNKYPWHEYQAALDYNMLAQNDWNEYTTPKIDLFVTNLHSNENHKTLWVKT